MEEALKSHAVTVVGLRLMLWRSPIQVLLLLLGKIVSGMVVEVRGYGDADGL